MATFVLVHGAWHGAWCWERVVPLLTAGGHTVETPTLAGLGERAAELRPEIDLETHVAEVTASIDPDGPRDVVLVGHSYSGMVVAAVAARRAERIARIVYLDAFVPEDGQALFDILGPPGLADGFREQARLHGEGWRMPVPTPQRMGIVDEDDARWLAERLTPQSIATFEQPVRFGAEDPSPELVPRMFIHCIQDPPSPVFLPIDRARSTPGWTLHELTTGHDAMLIVPDDLARLLLDAAAGVPSPIASPPAS